MLACWMMTAVLGLGLAQAPPTTQHPRPGAKQEPARRQGRAAAGNALDQAQTALGRNDYARAEALLKEYLAAHPGHAPAELDLGYAEAGLGHRQQAIAAYQAGLKAQPKHFAAQFNLGLLLLAAHQPRAALAPLQAAAKLQPQDAKPWFQLARAQEMLGQTTAAAAAYQSAARLDPGGTAAEFNAGILWLKAGNDAAAAQALATVTERQPRNAAARKALADAYARGGETAKAVAALQAYLALRPGDQAARRRLAGLLVKQKDPRAARGQLEAALGRNPNDTTARRELAEMQMSAQQYAKAAANYGILARAQPASAERQYDFGHALLLSGDFAQSLQPLQTAVRLAPDMAAGWRDLGFAAYQVKQYSPAVAALDRYAALAGAGPGARSSIQAPTDFLRAVCWDHLHAYRRAITQYEAFLAADHNQHYNEDFKARHRLITLRRMVAGQ